jgi:hypothetical protein
MNQDGVIGKIFSWGTSANYSDTTVSVWVAGLALVLILSFLWSTVVRQVLRKV